MVATKGNLREVIFDLEDVLKFSEGSLTKQKGRKRLELLKSQKVSLQWIEEIKSR